MYLIRVSQVNEKKSSVCFFAYLYNVTAIYLWTDSEEIHTFNFLGFQA
jgi:hypothetical protein